MIIIIQNGPICRIVDGKSLVNFYSKVVFNNMGMFRNWVALGSNNEIKFLASKLDKMINFIYLQNLTVELR